MTDPGVYDDLTDASYHADPALSSSGARRLLPPSCPARFKWERDHGRPEKRQYDFGRAAHGLVLGIGAPVVIVDAADWRTKGAKAQRDEAYAAGHVPILAAEWTQVEGMARALLEHPIASELLDPATGRAEVSLFWHDDRHDVDKRARLDWLPQDDDGRLIVPDYKTTLSAEPRHVEKSFWTYGYHQQAAFYIDGIRALDLADEVGFVFIFQEKTPPYLITVVEPDQESLAIGRAVNDRAAEVFAECTATDTWPAYTDDIETVSLPEWMVRDFIKESAA